MTTVYNTVLVPQNHVGKILIKDEKLSTWKIYVCQIYYYFMCGNDKRKPKLCN